MTLAVAAGGVVDRDGAAGAPDEVGRVRADHHQPASLASAPPREPAGVDDGHRVHLVLVEARRRAAGRHQRQPVLDRRVRRPGRGRWRAPSARRPSPGSPRSIALPGDLAGVRRREAALEQRAARGQRELVLDARGSATGNPVGDHDLAHALLDARRRRPRRSRRGTRWPVASTSPCRAIAREHVARLRAALRRPRRPPAPARSRRRAARRSRCSSTQTGSLRARRERRVSSPLSFTESTVGNQTVRAPSRAAISTATGFIPPTARFSAIGPRTSTPGTRRAHDRRRAPPSSV